jgi:hypothetical protein
MDPLSGESLRRTRRDPPWPGVLIRIVPILLALAVLRPLLGLQDDVAGLLIQLALVVLLSVVWGAVLLVILRYRGSSR